MEIRSGVAGRLRSLLDLPRAVASSSAERQASLGSVAATMAPFRARRAQQEKRTQSRSCSFVVRLLLYDASCAERKRRQLRVSRHTHCSSQNARRACSPCQPPGSPETHDHPASRARCHSCASQALTPHACPVAHANHPTLRRNQKPGQFTSASLARLPLMASDITTRMHRNGVIRDPQKHTRTPRACTHPACVMAIGSAMTICLLADPSAMLQVVQAKSLLSKMARVVCLHAVICAPRVSAGGTPPLLFGRSYIPWCAANDLLRTHLQLCSVS